VDLVRKGAPRLGVARTLTAQRIGNTLFCARKRSGELVLRGFELSRSALCIGFRQAVGVAEIGNGGRASCQAICRFARLGGGVLLGELERGSGSGARS
jgi:hypothetical protein